MKRIREFFKDIKKKTKEKKRVANLVRNSNCYGTTSILSKQKPIKGMHELRCGVAVNELERN